MRGDDDIMSDDGPPAWVGAYCDQLVTHLKSDLHDALTQSPPEDYDHNTTVRMFMAQHGASHHDAWYMARGWDLAIAAMAVWVEETVRDGHEHR